MKKLIAGGKDVYICDECVELCAELIEEETANDASEGLEGINLLKPKEIKKFQLDQ